jgi:hypothetical protein
MENVYAYAVLQNINGDIKLRFADALDDQLACTL